MGSSVCFACYHSTGLGVFQAMNTQSMLPGWTRAFRGKEVFTRKGGKRWNKAVVPLPRSWFDDFPLNEGSSGSPSCTSGSKIKTGSTTVSKKSGLRYHPIFSHPKVSQEDKCQKIIFCASCCKQKHIWSQFSLLPGVQVFSRNFKPPGAFSPQFIFYGMLFYVFPRTSLCGSVTSSGVDDDSRYWRRHRSAYRTLSVHIRPSCWGVLRAIWSCFYSVAWSAVPNPFSPIICEYFQTDISHPQYQPEWGPFGICFSWAFANPVFNDSIATVQNFGWGFDSNFVCSLCSRHKSGFIWQFFVSPPLDIEMKFLVKC